MATQEQPEASKNRASGDSGQAAVEGKKRRKGILIVGVVLVLVILAAAGVFLGLRTKPAAEGVPARAVPEAIGPRSIFEGLDRLEEAHWRAQSNYLADVNQLIELHAKDDKQFSPAWKAAVSNEVAKSNLFVRVLPRGFEATLRQGERRWLVYSREGTSAPRITTQQTDGPPPFGGASEAAEPMKVERLELDLEEYRDRREYFSVMLPKGFVVSESGQPPNVRTSFTYTNNVRMTVKAMESNRGWDPLTELVAKAEQIQSGSVPAFADFRLSVTNLLDVEGGTGYEMGLIGVRGKAGLRSHTFALGGERTMLSIAVLCPSEDAAPFYESLLAGIRDTLRIGLGPQRRIVFIPSNTVESAAIGKEPQAPVLTEEEKKQWREARSLLKTTGIIQSGKDYVALVNDQLLRANDVIIVSMKGKAFRFRVAAITTENIDFEPVLSNKDNVAEDQKGL